MQTIAKEILDREGFKLLHNTNSEASDFSEYLLFDNEGVIDEPTGGQYSLSNVVLSIAQKKARHLKPETLGKIISTCVGSSDNQTRTSWCDIFGTITLLDDSDTGISILRNFAAATISAVVYDELLKNMEEKSLTEEELDAYPRSDR